MKFTDNHINYVEFKAKDLKKIKDFYHNSFQWSFTDYGSTYTTFTESGIHGGFELTENEITKGVLIVMYHKDLSLIKNRIVEFGGKITKDIFTFPGGRRFHFEDPSGNELAVWSDK